MATTTTTTTDSTGQYLYGPSDLRRENRPLPTPGPDEVQVAIRAVTLCGSDLHYFHKFRNGSIQVREPLCLGHESAGTVVAVGENAPFTVGDRVALEVGVSCGKCAVCRDGKRYNICSGLRFRSSGSAFPHYQGVLQQRVNHPAAWVHRLPAALKDDAVGALLEPLAVAVHSARRSQFGGVSVDGKKTCIILGAGAVGLLMSVAARVVTGVEEVLMADIDAGRLAFAKENGYATATYQVPMRPRPANVDEAMKNARETAEAISQQKWLDGKPVGRVATTFECTGVESCLQTTIFTTLSGGNVMVVGLGTPNHTLPISEATAREITLIPCWRYSQAYPQAIDIAVASVTGQPLHGVKLPNIGQLISHRFSGLDSVQEAFATAGKTKDGDGNLVLKAVVELK